MGTGGGKLLSFPASPKGHGVEQPQGCRETPGETSSFKTRILPSSGKMESPCRKESVQSQLPPFGLVKPLG